ncbi:hypothetical protein NP233_g10058 [Leucocoprinus birnbaumii]|uniref:Mitochondrial K+-H+ exchange-related-domain-containing protein n=1 Tax=Leucocoprinus birnbaumii TaxID=56174 RepID=A0AAD5YS91_9AGAR|nr:hypothetical protein NP233_g10058 [Leucocoprinus birnbaumii]
MPLLALSQMSDECWWLYARTAPITDALIGEFVSHSAANLLFSLSTSLLTINTPRTIAFTSYSRNFAMSLVPRSLQKLRIIAVPLTLPKPSPLDKGATRHLARHNLIYYALQTSSPAPTKSISDNAPKSRWLPEEGIVSYLQAKAAATWSSFGKSEQGSWKLKTYQLGERLMDRIEFEELALKALDPSLGPPVAGKSTHSEKRPQIPLIHPSSISSEDSMTYLRTFLEHRTPQHRRGFYFWMFISPLTAPLTIIPVIPNFPFFFCVWRSWSHYKAYRSSRYLQALLSNDSIVPESSDALDAIFKESSAPVVAAQEEPEEIASEKHEIVLTRGAIPPITRLFELSESSNADLYRAIEQARLRLEGSRPEGSS